MAALIASGAGVETVGNARLAGLGTAGALAGVGALFLKHEQHGSGEARAQAERAHRLGYSLLAAAGAKAADTVRAPGPWRFTWPALGLTVAGPLLTYRESAGAYE
jgi:hypothetical protein